MILGDHVLELYVVIGEVMSVGGLWAGEDDVKSNDDCSAVMGHISASDMSVSKLLTVNVNH